MSETTASEAVHKSLSVREFLDSHKVHKLLETFVLAVADRRPPDVLLYMEQWASQQRLDRDGKGTTAATSPTPQVKAPRSLPTTEQAAWDRVAEAWSVIGDPLKVSRRFFLVLSQQHSAMCKRLFVGLDTDQQLAPALAPLLNAAILGQLDDAALEELGRVHGSKRQPVMQERHFHAFLTAMLFAVKVEYEAKAGRAVPNTKEAAAATGGPGDATAGGAAAASADHWQTVLQSIATSVARGAVASVAAGDGPPGDPSAPPRTDDATNTVGADPGRIVTTAPAAARRQSSQQQPTDTATSVSPASPTAAIGASFDSCLATSFRRTPLSVWSQVADPVSLCRLFFTIFQTQHASVAKALLADINTDVIAPELAQGLTALFDGTMTSTELRGLAQVHALKKDGSMRRVHHRYGHYFVTSMMGALQVKLGDAFNAGCSAVMTNALTAVAETVTCAIAEMMAASTTSTTEASSTSAKSSPDASFTVDQQDSFTNTLSQVVVHAADIDDEDQTVGASTDKSVLMDEAKRAWRNGTAFADKQTLCADFFRILTTQHPALKRTLFRGRDIEGDLLPKYQPAFEALMTETLTVAELRQLVKTHAPNTTQPRHAYYWFTSMLTVIHIRVLEHYETTAGRLSEDEEKRKQVKRLREGFRLLLHRALAVMCLSLAARVDSSGPLTAAGATDVERAATNTKGSSEMFADLAEAAPVGAVTAQPEDSAKAFPKIFAWSDIPDIPGLATRFFAVLLSQHPMMKKNVFLDVDVGVVSAPFAALLNQAMLAASSSGGAAVSDDAIKQAVAVHGKNRKGLQHRHFDYFVTAMLFATKSHLTAHSLSMGKEGMAALQDSFQRIATLVAAEALGGTPGANAVAAADKTNTIGWK